MTNLLRQAYNPDFFRKQGHELVDILADYLKEIQQKNTVEKTIDWKNPEELLQEWQKDLNSAPNKDYHSFFKKVIQQSNHLHHPKYVGHQTSAVAPLAALGDFFGAFLDKGMGIFEQGGPGVVMERLLLKKVAEKMNMSSENADGFFTNGGTLGNLTALLSARSVMIEREVWEHGFEGKKYGFLVSEEAHYSVDRAVRIMGMGNLGLVKVPTNDLYQLDISKLESSFQEAEKQDIKIIGVVASACATAVGGHDDLNAIADFCEAKKLWLHVDAAHGGPVIFSEKYKYLLKGIHRADSVIMDFHKMAMMPTLVTAVIYKNGDDSYKTFAQKASYLWDNQEGQEWYNLAKRTFELTKTSISYRLYLLWRTYGDQIFADNIEVTYDNAKLFAKMIAEDEDFEMAVKTPESNIICYRFKKNGLTEPELDDLNAKIRQNILFDGEYYIVQTRIRGRLFLRSTIINPFTTKEHFKGLLEKIKSFGE